MATSHDTNERRQAVWPWILMPLIVLLVAYLLHDMQDAAKSAAAQSQSHSPASASSDQ